MEPFMKSALLVIDVQQSFVQRPYWGEEDVQPFLQRTQHLIDQFEQAGASVLQIFHLDESNGPTGAFSRHSGHVRTLAGLRIHPAEVFFKSVHSALFASNADGQSLDYWLRRNAVERLVVTGIRTEQCCETTTRHASDLGYSVIYAGDATLTFPMVSVSGREFSAKEIRERTELVLEGRFARVQKAEAVQI
jgi:nicotinamidase-related amidase